MNARILLLVSSRPFSRTRVCRYIEPRRWLHDAPGAKSNHSVEINDAQDDRFPDSSSSAPPVTTTSSALIEKVQYKTQNEPSSQLIVYPMALYQKSGLIRDFRKYRTLFAVHNYRSKGKVMDRPDFGVLKFRALSEAIQAHDEAARKAIPNFFVGYRYSMPLNVIYISFTTVRPFHALALYIVQHMQNPTHHAATYEETGLAHLNLWYSTVAEAAAALHALQSNIDLSVAVNAKFASSFGDETRLAKVLQWRTEEPLTATKILLYPNSFVKFDPKTSGRLAPWEQTTSDASSVPSLAPASPAPAPARALPRRNLASSNLPDSAVEPAKSSPDTPSNSLLVWGSNLADLRRLLKRFPTFYLVVPDKTFRAIVARFRTKDGAVEAFEAIKKNPHQYDNIKAQYIPVATSRRIMVRYYFMGPVEDFAHIIEAHSKGMEHYAFVDRRRFIVLYLTFKTEGQAIAAAEAFQSSLNSDVLISNKLTVNYVNQITSEDREGTFAEDRDQLTPAILLERTAHFFALRVNEKKEREAEAAAAASAASAEWKASGSPLTPPKKRRKTMAERQDEAMETLRNILGPGSSLFDGTTTMNGPMGEQEVSEPGSTTSWSSVWAVNEASASKSTTPDSAQSQPPLSSSSLDPALYPSRPSPPHLNAAVPPQFKSRSSFAPRQPTTRVGLPLLSTPPEQESPQTTEPSPYLGRLKELRRLREAWNSSSRWSPSAGFDHSGDGSDDRDNHGLDESVRVTRSRQVATPSRLTMRKQPRPLPRDQE